MKPCPLCSGAGRLSAFLEAEDKSVPCWACHGTGVEKLWYPRREVRAASIGSAPDSE